MGDCNHLCRRPRHQMLVPSNEALTWPVPLKRRDALALVAHPHPHLDLHAPRRRPIVAHQTHSACAAAKARGRLISTSGRSRPRLFGWPRVEPLDALGGAHLREIWGRYELWGDMGR